MKPTATLEQKATKTTKLRGGVASTKGVKDTAGVATKEPEHRTLNIEHPTSKPEPGNGRVYVDIDWLTPDPEQPRREFDTEKLKALAETIKELGIAQDLIVQDYLPKASSTPGLVGIKYQIVDGERRWRAAKLAGLKMVPIALREVGEKDKLSVQLIVNQQHENLSELEEAAAYKREMEAGKTADEIAKRLGVSRGTVFGRLTLNKLSDPVRAALLAGKINTSVARLLTLVPNPAKQQEALEKVQATDWSTAMPFRRAQEEVQQRYCKGLGDASFKLDDAQLLPAEWEVSDGKDEVILRQALPKTVKLTPQLRARTGNRTEDDGMGHKRTIWNVWTGEAGCTGGTCLGDELNQPTAKLLVSMINAGKPLTVSRRRGGACTDCPYRTGNLAEEFPDLAKRPNVCTQPSCYAAKESAAKAKIIGEAKAAGKTVLTQGESKGIFASWDPTSPRGDYLDLKERCPEDPKQRPYEKILGGAAPEPVFALNGNDKLQKVWPRAAVAKALAEKGIKAKKESNGGGDGNKAYQEKQRKIQERTQAREKVWQALLPALIEKLEHLPTGADAACWRMMIAAMAEDWGGGDVQQRRKLGSLAKIETLEKIKGVSELRGLALELTFNEGLDYNGEWVEGVTRACELAGIDLAAEEKKLAQPEPAKAAGTVKAAGKKKARK